MSKTCILVRVMEAMSSGVGHLAPTRLCDKGFIGNWRHLELTYVNS